MLKYSPTILLISIPSVITRGYIIVNENEELIKTIQFKARNIILNKLKNKDFNYLELKNDLITELMPLLTDKTGRVPIIMPILMDIKNYNYEETLKV